MANTPNWPQIQELISGNSEGDDWLEPTDCRPSCTQYCWMQNIFYCSWMPWATGLLKQGCTRDRLGSYTLCGRVTKCQQALVSAETNVKFAAHDTLKNVVNSLMETERLKVLCCLKWGRGSDLVWSCVPRLGSLYSIKITSNKPSFLLSE